MTKEPTIRDVLEVLQAHSTHMDEQFMKVDKRFDAVEIRLTRVEEDVRVLKQDVGVLKKDVREMKAVMATKSDIQDLVSKEYLEGRLVHMH